MLSLCSLLASSKKKSKPNAMKRKTASQSLTAPAGRLAELADTVVSQMGLLIASPAQKGKVSNTTQSGLMEAVNAESRE